MDDYRSLLKCLFEGRQHWYHITTQDLGEYARFRVQKPMGVDTEPDTPRISVADTVEGCIVALGSSVMRSGDRIYIYELDDPNAQLVEPSGVADWRVTGERWILQPVSFKRVGFIDNEDLPDSVRTLYPGDVKSIQKQFQIRTELEQMIGSIIHVGKD